MKMVKNSFGQKKNGFTLVELLVAILISGIVFSVIFAFVASGTNFYKKQSNSIDLQNELQQVSNKLSDSLMEATAIIINNDSQSLSLYTGEYETDQLGTPISFVSQKGNSRYLYWDGNSFYVTDSLNIAAEDLVGYDLSDYVTDLQISIDESCKKYQSQGGTFLGYQMPLIFQVTITVSNGGESITDHKLTTLRTTRLTRLVIQGVEQSLLQ